MYRRLSTSLVLVLTIAAIAVSAYFYGSKRTIQTIRSTFTFETTNEIQATHSPYNIESRYLPKKRGNIAIRTYIEDLLLGPISEHCKPIFDTKTRCLLCTKRSGTLKVDLSREAWLFAQKASDDALRELKEKADTEAAKAAATPDDTKEVAAKKDATNAEAASQSNATEAETVDPQVISESAKKASMIESMELLTTNIKNNFSNVKSVVITIEGVEPLSNK